MEKFTKSLNIHMVECSPTLRKVQYSALKCKDVDTCANNEKKGTITMLTGSGVSWHATLDQIPTGCMVSSSTIHLFHIIVHTLLKFN